MRKFRVFKLTELIKICWKETRDEIKTMFFFLHQGILSLMGGEKMTVSREESAETGHLIFLSPSVPHTCAEDSVFINVSISQYFPYYCDQRWSVQSGLSAFNPKWKLSGQLQNPFLKMLLLYILHLT